MERRDFTINAMAYHPQEGLIDLHGGREDLKAGLIRCVGDPDRRFREDGLRMLRCMRFAAVLGFRIEERTGAALVRCGPLLDDIAHERVPGGADQAAVWPERRPGAGGLCPGGRPGAARDSTHLRL